MRHANRPPVMEQPRPRAAEPAPSGPSKSQRKRDMHALQELGEELVALQPARLRSLALPESLLEAIEQAQRISSREGRRRQLQLIGKLMRQVDADPIRDALAVDGNRHRQEVALMHSAEHWREQLLAESDALARFRQRHPTAAQAADWPALIAGARAEHAAGQPSRRYRELYRALHAALLAEAAPPSPSSTPTPTE